MSIDYTQDALDREIHEAFAGKAVRKDLVHSLKKGTNVPTFVLEFLLARYCASDDPAEVDAGKAAVLEVLAKNFVNPNEANRAQSLVEQKGRYKFIDKVSVRFVEKEKRHWAAMQNFDSQRIAINPQFYQENDRLLEGGVWAEITLGYNSVEEDKYSFFVEELKPIQLSRFDFNAYTQGVAQFQRDQWLDVVLRSVGLEPAKLSHRLKLHYIARLAPLVEANYNFIELGPRGTGKSYFFSEFSPYCTLVGQTSNADLFYNNARRRVGKVGFWDVVAFDEVSNLRIKDSDTLQNLKSFMANGRFTRGAEVNANASFGFVGNLDESVEQIVNSSTMDLFLPLPEQLDLAIQDRFFCYLPGWEIPKNGSDYLTNRYGLITDYLAEAFHHMHRQVNRYEEVHRRAKLNRNVEGRDEKAVKKTLCAFLKILHPHESPTDAQFEEYLAYALEARRRVKEQMNKRKPDDEYANIGVGFINSAGQERVIDCPESRGASATQNPRGPSVSVASEPLTSKTNVVETVTQSIPDTAAPKEAHYTIHHDDTGYTYERIFAPYLAGAKEITIEDPFIRVEYQVSNLVRFCELLVTTPSIRKVHLITGYDNADQQLRVGDMLGQLQQSLLERDIEFSVEYRETIHDREVRLDNGWVIKIGRGLDIWQRPATWFELGASDLAQRRCRETKVDVFKG